MQSIILIPSYKPDGRLTDLARALRDKGQQVVVVDDGSGEAYRALYDKVQLFAQVVFCDANGGKGTALKTGLRYIQAHFQPPYTVTTADADGQHCLHDILYVAKTARKRNDALVLGCRTINHDMPMRNWLGNFFTKIAFLFATGAFVHDTQTGLRGFSHRLLPFMLAVKGSRYEYEINVLMRWARCNLPIAEVPIRTIYFKDNQLSHFQPVRDSFIIYGSIMKLSAPSLLCFALDVLLFCLLFFFSLPKGYPWCLPVANAAARAVSAALHFGLLQRDMRQEPVPRTLTARRYAAVAAGILLLNTLALWGLTALGLPVLGAKITADIALYGITFIPQRKLLYQKSGKEDLHAIF